MASVPAIARLSVIVGVGLASAVLAAPPESSVPTPGAAAGQTRPGRIHVALSTAIDCYRRSEYELAATYFQQAQAGLADLTPAQRQDLNQYLQLNNAALQSRREAHDQLQQAELAARAGRATEAGNLLKAVSAKQQFLSSADKQRAQQLGEQLRPTGGKPTASGTGANSPARSKFQQARILYDAGNLEAAETLAREADRFSDSFSPDEDSPRKLLDEISRVRASGSKTVADPKNLVTSARAALDKGDLDAAETLARQAEKASSTWSSLRPWGDSPSKVLRDVQTARARQAARQLPEKMTTTPATAEKDSHTTFGSIKTLWTRTNGSPSEEKTTPATAPVPEATPAAKNPADVGWTIPSATSPVVQTAATTPAPASTPAPAATPAPGRGQELLQQARQELRRGETAKARRLAEEAYEGQFGEVVQAEADKILRAIDTEEFNQRALTAVRATETSTAAAKPAATPPSTPTAQAPRPAAPATPAVAASAADQAYDQAFAAFQRKDYAQAKALFDTIEAAQLSADRQARMQAMLQVCAVQAAPAATQVVAKPATPAPAPAAPAEKPATPPATPAPVARVGDTEKAQQLLAQARAALAQGNTARARDLANQARNLRPDLAWDDDNPEKVLADVRRVESPKPAAAPKETATAETKTPQNPRTLLRQARDLYAAGDFDEAEKVAMRANINKTVRWGLFEDNPEKLLGEIRKARTRRDSEESAKLFAQARKLFAEGNLNEAERLTYRAEALHGPYSFWETDRPQKLRAEIDEARSKQRQTRLPPAPTTPAAVAKTSPATPATPAPKTETASARPQAAPAAPAAPAVAQASNPPPPMWPTETETRPQGPDPRKAEAQQQLAEARAALKAGDFTRAEALVAKVEAMGLVFGKSDEESPIALRSELLVARTSARAATATNEAKQAAQRLLAESRKLQDEGRLLEAYQKAQEAMRQNAAFGPDEDRPELARLAVAALAEKKIETVLQQSGTAVAAGASDPTRLDRAEVELLQARQLAEGLGLDKHPIEARLTAVRQARETKPVAQVTPPASPAAATAPVTQVQHTEPAPTGAARGQTLLSQALAELRKGETAAARRIAQEVRQGPYGLQLDADKVLQCIDAEEANQKLLAGSRTGQPVPETVQQRGLSLLSQARLELRKGETGNARRLAEEAMAGPFGVQSDAAALLRTIDVEEYNQRSLTANRSFDAGQSAFLRKDYAQAASIFRTIETPLLKPEKQAKLKEIMLTPEMQPRAVAQAVHKAPTGADGAEAGRARASDQATATAPAKTTTPEESFALQVKAMQEIKFQKLRTDGLRILSEATERFQAGDTDRALEMLQEYTASLRDQELDADRLTMLKRPMDARLQQFRTLKAQRDLERLQAGQHESASKMLSRIALAEENKKKEVAKLIQQANTLFKEGKYKESEMYAMKAQELDPDNPVPGAAIYRARIQASQTDYDKVKRNKEEMFRNGLNDAEDPGPTVTSHDPLVVDPKVMETARKRKSIDIININTKTEKEREIERRLLTPVSINFKDMPLQQVIDDLKDITGINIVPDLGALNEEGISLSRPVTMSVEQVALKSVLNLLLKQVHLTYVVKDEVLQITTEANARGKLVVRQYGVADLVIPVENSSLPTNNNLIRTALQQSEPNVQLNGAAPYLGSNSLQNGQPVGTASSGMGQLANNQAPGGPLVTKHGPQQTMQELLIKLITNTIAPNSWSDMGGPGTIEYFPLGMALVINQTPDIQEQIAELLTALRRLQDQEVSVEVRFITIAESFFERIGLDFNINLKTDKYTTKYEPMIVSQQFKPFGYVNDFNPKSTVIGLTPANSFTPDLDIPIRSSSFNQAIPPFGAFPNIPGGNGGLELGLAFLSDIQVFMFMEAAQGDQRTNVTQAPKLTLFNGQTANIFISDMQFFVTNVTVVQVGGQVVFVPQNNLIPTGGVNLTVQAVISADRRFVRLNIVPSITNITSAVVQLFPITTFITPVFEGGAVGQPIPFTQFLQQPVFNTVSIQTTVTVPDGGTVLMGGLKRLSEGRNEFGPPILSKIPYINRLFKNVGYGREAESLLIMVTPRIIINEEEEMKQTGVSAEGPVALPGPAVP